MLGDLIV